MGKTNAARREINEIKRLDSDLARVRRSETPFVKVHEVYIQHRKISYCLIRTDTKMLCPLFLFLERS